MDFIFMLTRADQTVSDCLEVFEGIADSGVTHMGYKDVGVDRSTLEDLTRRIKQAGFISYMEVVSTSLEASLESARTAAAVGVDRLMGGTAVRETLQILAGSPVAYYPFPGRPEGHPTRLGGTPEDIAEHCRIFEDMGCAGVDLLAYRAFEAEPLALVQAARAALQGDLIVAGSIATPQQIGFLAEAGVDAFTIGSAAFDGSFSPRKGALNSQLRDILNACGPPPAPPQT